MRLGSLGSLWKRHFRRPHRGDPANGEASVRRIWVSDPNPKGGTDLVNGGLRVP